MVEKMNLPCADLGRGLHPAILALVLLSSCDSKVRTLKRPDMTALSSRLEMIFQTTSTVCFSHFTIEIPSTAVVVYGPAVAEASIEYFPGAAAAINERVNAQLAAIEEYRMFLNAQNIIDYPLFGKTINGSLPESKIAFGSKNQVGYDLYAFFPVGGHLFVQTVNSSLQHERRIRTLNSVASSLRLRAHNEIPTEPGSCIDGAFIPIPLQYEKVTLGIRLKEFPDVHFSIEVQKNQNRVRESGDLETRLRNAEIAGGEWFSRVRFLRKGERQLGAWIGSEALALKPAQEVEKQSHEFHFISLGEPNTPLQPRVDIQLDTGASGHQQGAVTPSLTDAEAVALWDKLTSSIRVRATDGSKKIKTPLDTTAETGTVCPESGWWLCDEGGALQSDRRKHVDAGEPMPYTTVSGHQTLWQKLKGERPKFRAATVWKLAEYDAAPPPL